MLVTQILASKVKSGVFTIKPTAKVAEATMMLSEQRVGALIVSEIGDLPDGVLSERDIVREIGQNGANILDDTVSSIMSAKVISCSPDNTTDEVLRLMTSGRFRHMPVVENDRMIGLISIGDVVKARLDELNLERDALENMITGH